MSAIDNYLPGQTTAGPILAIAGLVLVNITLFARHYSRSLYFIQILYVCSVIYKPATSTKGTYSSHLNYSTLDWVPRFISGIWCKESQGCKSSTQYNYQYGGLLSAAVLWVLLAIFFFLLIKIIACKKKEAKFLSFYNWGKGYSYWFFPPLTFASVYAVVNAIKDLSFKEFHMEVLVAVIVLAAFVVIAIMELIAYKCAQREEENKARKWIQFWTHVAIGSVMTFLALYNANGASIYKYLPNIGLGTFAIIYIIWYKFRARVLERIFAICQEGIIIAVYNIFAFNYDIIADRAIDFYAIVLVMLIEVVELIIKLVLFCKYKGIDDDDPAVTPEKEDRNQPRNIRNSFTNEQINPELSYDGLKGSNVNSPRRGAGAAPPRRK